MTSRHRPAALLLALALCGPLLACGDDGADVSAESSTTTAPPATVPATTTPTTGAPATATTQPPTTASAPTTSAPAGPAGCDEGTVLTGDVDGDGTPDTIALVSDPAAYTSVLRTCTAEGTSEIDALGASVVRTADLDGDGAVEILYGGTAATSETVQVARIVDGTLVTVTAGGGPLMLVDGYPDGTPPDGPRHAYGCGGTVDGTPVHLIVLRVTPINAAEYAFSLEATGYVLDGGTATTAATQSVTSAAGTPGGTPEELVAYANEIVAENAPAC